VKFSPQGSFKKFTKGCCEERRCQGSTGKESTLSTIKSVGLMFLA